MKKPTGLSKVRDVFLEVGVGWGKRHGTTSSCQPSHVTVEVCRLKGSDTRGKGVDRLLGQRSYRCGVGVLTKGRGLGPSAHVEAGIRKEDLDEQGCVWRGGGECLTRVPPDRMALSRENEAAKLGFLVFAPPNAGISWV